MPPALLEVKMIYTVSRIRGGCNAAFEVDVLKYCEHDEELWEVESVYVRRNRSPENTTYYGFSETKDGAVEAILDIYEKSKRLGRRLKIYGVDP